MPQEIIQPSVPPEMSKTNWIGFGLIVAFVAAALGLLVFLYITSFAPDKKEATSSASQAVVSKDGQVQVTSDGFEPAVIKISKGAKVVWVNVDEAIHRVASDPHPVHTILAGLDSGDLETDVTYSFTFKEKGSFKYHDHMNPFKFNGEVVVE